MKFDEEPRLLDLREVLGGEVLGLQERAGLGLEVAELRQERRAAPGHVARGGAGPGVPRVVLKCFSFRIVEKEKKKKEQAEKTSGELEKIRTQI